MANKMKKLRNKQLDEIDDIYIKVEKYVPIGFLVDTLKSNKGQEEYQKNGKLYLEKYNEAFDRFKALAPSLKPEEAIDGYINGSILLHRNLSGYMIADQFFDDAYLPIMIQAIKDDNTEPLYGFLLTLSGILDEAIIIELVSIGLESQYYRMKITACGIAEQKKFVQFIPKIRKLLNDEPIPVVDAAKGALELLESEIID
jgi:hypothetical protein